MVKFVRPAIRVQPTLSVTPRPLPRSLIDTYYQTEGDFRRLIERLESDPRFDQLVKKGVLQKVRLKGRIPHHRYEECKDEEMVAFFKKYDVTRHADWEQDFLNPAALGRKYQISKKYGAPVGELLSILRYTAFLSTMRDTLHGSPCTSTDLGDSDFLRFTPSDTVFDTGPVAAGIQAFVEKYGLERETFVSCFLAHHIDEERVLGVVGCSREELTRVREMVERLQVLNSFCVDAGPAREPAPRKGERFGPVAEFYKVGDGLDVRVNMVDDGVYTAKYRISAESSEAGGSLNRTEQEFLNQLRAINQRKNVIHRLVTFLFKYQYRYLLTGDPLDLYPLSQAAAAKAIFEEEATISRLIRDKTLVTPYGVVPMKFFFHRVAKTVENLVLVRERQELEGGVRDRPFTDIEIARILREQYAVELSRRSITYHRNRCLKKSNFYARHRQNRANPDEPHSSSGR